MCHYVQKTEDLPTPEKSLKELEKQYKNKLINSKRIAN